MRGFRTTRNRNNGVLRTFVSYYDLAYRSANVETQLWVDRINALGGKLSAWEVAHVSQFSEAIASFTKVKYLLPCVGSGIACHRTPLRDSFNVGAATNSGFVDADATTAGGLANATEASKFLSSLLKPSQLGTSNNAGMGWLELNWGNGTGVEPMGCYNSGGNERYVLDLRSTLISFRYGSPSNAASQSVTAGNHRYYGQRASATSRALYVDGAHVGTDSTTSDSASGAGNGTIYIHGSNEPGGTVYWKGACGGAWLTSGDMTTTEISDFDGLVASYLKTLLNR